MIVPERTARNRVPVSFGGQRLDLLFDPRKPDALAEIEIGASRVGYGELRRLRDLDHVERAVQGIERGDARRERLRYALLDELRAVLRKPGLLGATEDARQLAHQLGSAGPEAPHGALDIEIAALIRQQPIAHVPQNARGSLDRRVLHGRRDAIVERFDRGPEASDFEHFACDRVSAGNCREIRAGVGLRAHREYGTHAVDHAVGDRGRDDLAAQAMALEALREALLHRSGKITRQLRRQVDILGYVGVDQRLVGPDLAVAQYDREFGTREPRAGLAPLGDVLLGRKKLERAIQVPGALECSYHLGGLAEALFSL